MAGLASAEFADAMKTYYLSPLNDQVVRAKVLLDRLEKNSEDVEGNFAYIPVMTGRNPGVGSRKDVAGSGPALPTAGRGTYDAATFKMAIHYGRGQISGPVMRASKSSSGAFAKALDVEMKNLMESLPENLNRQITAYGHGRVGTVSANGVTAATSVEVYSTSHFNAKIGDRVVMGTIASGTLASAASRTISAIDRDTDVSAVASTTKHKITLSGTVAASFTAGTNTLYFGGDGAGTAPALGDISFAQEMYGLQSLVDDGANAADEDTAGIAAEFIDASLSWGSIDRTAAANVDWRAQVLKNPDSAGTNRALTVSLMEQAFLTALVVGGASEKSIEIYSNAGLWATFGALHIGDRRYNDYQETLEGGWLALKFNGRPFMFDRDLPRDMIFFLDMSKIFLLTQSGYELMDDDGSVLSRVSNTDAYEFTLYRDVQLGARNCKSHVRLDDIASIANIEANV